MKDIPMKEITNYMKRLSITKEEAIDLWLSDNDLIENEEVEKLTKKAKENKINIRVESGERKKKEVTKKENPTKERIIKELAATLNHIGAVNIKITNISKLIEFEINGNNYKLDLIQKRQPKN